MLIVSSVESFPMIKGFCLTFSDPHFLQEISNDERLVTLHEVVY
jgi:hypothetical protein